MRSQRHVPRALGDGGGAEAIGTDRRLHLRKEVGTTPARTISRLARDVRRSARAAWRRSAAARRSTRKPSTRRSSRPRHRNGGQNPGRRQLWNYGLFKKSRTLAAWAICTPKNSKVSNEQVLEPQSVSAPGPYSLSAGAERARSPGGGLAADPAMCAVVARMRATWPTARTPTPSRTTVGRFDRAPRLDPGHLVDGRDLLQERQPHLRDEHHRDDRSGEGQGHVPERQVRDRRRRLLARAADASAHIAASKPIDSNQDNDKIPDDGWEVEMSDPNQPTLQAGVGGSLQVASFVRKRSRRSS